MVLYIKILYLAKTNSPYENIIFWGNIKKIYLMQIFLTRVKTDNCSHGNFKSIYVTSVPPNFSWFSLFLLPFRFSITFIYCIHALNMRIFHNRCHSWFWGFLLHQRCQ